MAGLLKNSTIGGSSTSTSSSTSNYGFPPSGSFTHQKQPVMPKDQKAKLLAMHRDGKANAGIYVAIVLFVYFILVILLLYRYGKRRRRTTSESGLESTTEQGRFHLLTYGIRRVVNCGGDDGCHSCCLCLPHLPFCPRRCQQMESSGKPAAMLNLDDSGKLGGSRGPPPTTLSGKGGSDQVEQNRISEVTTEISKVEADSTTTLREELKEDQQGGLTKSHQHPQHDDSDNEESIEED